MSLRDTLLQVGYVLMAVGAVLAVRAILAGPLSRLSARFGIEQRTRDHEDDPET